MSFPVVRCAVRACAVAAFSAPWPHQSTPPRTRRATRRGGSTTQGEGGARVVGAARFVHEGAVPAADREPGEFCGRLLRPGLASSSGATGVPFDQSASSMPASPGTLSCGGRGVVDDGVPGGRFRGADPRHPECRPPPYRAASRAGTVRGWHGDDDVDRHPVRVGIRVRHAGVATPRRSVERLGHPAGDPGGAVDSLPGRRWSHGARTALPVRVPQPPLVQLAVGVAGHLGDEVDALGPLVPGELLGAVVEKRGG